MTGAVLFFAIAGGVAVGETISGINLSIIAAKLNKRNSRRAMNLAGSFAALHDRERNERADRGV